MQRAEHQRLFFVVALRSGVVGGGEVMEADMTPGLRACQRLHVLATNEMKGRYTRHSNLKSLLLSSGTYM